MANDVIRHSLCSRFGTFLRGYRLVAAIAPLFCVLLIISSACAQTLPAELPRDELLVLYRTELGSAFQESQVDALINAHRLIEQFFTERDSKRRLLLVEQLEATGLGATTIGRLCRIRLGWPELPGGVYYINERVGPHNVVYFLGLPKDYARTRTWPLVVRLPRADVFLVEPRPDQQEVAKIYTDWIDADLKAHPDAIVLMPLLNFDHLFGPGYAGTNAVMQPIFHAAGRVNIDPARVCLIGHSAGGHAAWNLGLHYPTYFAAINPMAASAAGEFQRVRIRCLRNTLPVVWHDADDDLIKVDKARQIVRALRGQKIDVDYLETKKLGHNPPQQIVEKLYGKLRARTRTLYPNEVLLQSNRLDPIFNRVDWMQVDQPTRPGDEQRMFLSRGTERIMLQGNPWAASAKLARKNFVEIKAENVELLRLYFNEQLVDFDRALSVSVNGKVRFEGFVKPDLKAMMNDQLFLGRGWRYFTAVLPLDLAPTPATRPAR